MSAETYEFILVEKVPAKQERACEHNDQGREDPVDSSSVELAERKYSALKCVDDDAGYEVARQNKEDVDADKSSAESMQACMEGDDAQNGDRAEPVNLGPVAEAVRLCRMCRQEMYFPLIQ